MNNINTKKLKLTKKSKFLIIIRVILLFFLCIYIPLEVIFSSSFDQMENKIIFDNLDKYLPDFVKEKTIIKITDYLLYLFADRDMILLYTGLIYMTSHPFIAMKIVFVIHFAEFFLVILRCLYRAFRPIWYAKEYITYLCLTSYANPSMHFFFLTFFYIYVCISFFIFNKKKKKLSFVKKMLFITIFILVIIFFGVITIIKRINYLYQLIFALNISLIMIVIFLDLENLVHNYIFKSLKNIYKIRKHKIRLFLITLAMNIFSVFIFNFIQNENVELVYTNSSQNSNCSSSNLMNLGLKSTFNGITFNYGLIGAYYGVSLTIEKNCGVWWITSSRKTLVVKLFFTILFGSGYFFLFSLYESTSFEFNYFMFSVKYFLFNYLMMGWLPIVFDLCRLDKKIHYENKKKPTLFSHSHLLYSDEKAFNIREKEKKKLYSETILVENLEAKKSLNLDFLVGKQTLVDADISKKEDSYLNI